MFRYATVSVISTVVSFSVLGLVFGVFRLWSEVPSTVFANLVASVPAYYLNRTWSWGKSGRSHVFKEVVPFWTMTAIGITMSIGTASLAATSATSTTSTTSGGPWWSRAPTPRPSRVLWIVKFLVFNRLFHVDPVAHADAELFVEAVVEVEGAEP